MKSNYLRYIILLVITILLISCSSSNNEIYNFEDELNQAKTVKVTKGNIAATLSGTVEVKQASNFAIFTSSKAYFKSYYKIGKEIKKGQAIALIGDVEVIAPVDCTLVDYEYPGTFPANYPVMELSYKGFSINLTDNNFLGASSNLDGLTGKFQIRNGIGPTDVYGFVRNKEDFNIIECLVSVDDDVKINDKATIVIKSSVKENVLLLPISVVAGRKEKGSVNKLVDGKFEIVEVKLGISDGSHIEIIEGLNENDVVSTLAPNLEPRYQYGQYN